MIQQLEISFQSPSPINTEKLSGQNRRLLDYLLAGNSIHVFHPAKRLLQIGYLNSRIADIKKHGIEVHKRYISVNDIDGKETSVVEYSLTPFI